MIEELQLLTAFIPRQSVAHQTWTRSSFEGLETAPIPWRAPAPQPHFAGSQFLTDPASLGCPKASHSRFRLSLEKTEMPILVASDTAIKLGQKLLPYSLRLF